MNKRLFTIFFALLVSVIFALPVSAAGDMPRLVDEASLLSDSEKAGLLEKLDEISNRQQVDIVVVTVESVGETSPMEYADDFYDYYGYGFGDENDGILLLISMAERDWYISTTGYGIRAVTDAGREYIAERMTEDLSGGSYAAAFTIFAELCDDFLIQAGTGEPYDTGNLPREPFGLVENLLVTFGAAFLISLIATGIMRSSLKSVHSQSEADSYIKSGSMKLTRRSDLFLYRNVERRERQESESRESTGGSETHTSSSGKTHGGGGGKF